MLVGSCRSARGWRGVAIFALRAARESFVPPFEFRETVRQIFELGLRSAPLIAVSGMAVGVVLSMHTRASLERFGAESMIPAGLAIALVRETGPLTAGLLLSGRIGAGIGAELGAMRVTEQIDALEATAVDSFRYLVVTRVIACVIALPILTTLMNFAGMLGGFIAETTATGMSLTLYFTPRVLPDRPDRLRSRHDEDDGLRLHHRHDFVLSGVHDRVGHRRRRPRIDARRRVVVDADHRRQRRARAADLLHLPEGGRRMSEAAADAAAPAVRLEHVSKTFGSRAVLDDVSFDVARGSGFVILGRSGTGKSVTLRHIIGLMRPDRGRVFVDGDEISALDGPELSRVRRRIGFLFQNAALFDSITRRRERGVSAAPAHEAEGSGDSRAGDGEARGGRSRERVRQDAGGAVGRHAQARRPGARDGARSRRSCSSTSRAPASIPLPPTRSTSCCSN